MKEPMSLEPVAQRSDFVVQCVYMRVCVCTLQSVMSQRTTQIKNAFEETE